MYRSIHRGHDKKFINICREARAFNNQPRLKFRRLKPLQTIPGYYKIFDVLLSSKNPGIGLVVAIS